MIEYKINIIPKWEIKGYENYIFGKDNNLYSLKTNKMLKMKVKGGYTKGYNLNGKFKTLNFIRPLLTKYKENECPF